MKLKVILRVIFQGGGITDGREEPRAEKNRAPLTLSVSDPAD